MDSTDPEIAQEVPGIIRVYKDGRVERFIDTDSLPAGTDPLTGVSSKDLAIHPDSAVSVRIYRPNNPNPAGKLPLLIYFHGGGFFASTPASPNYHNYLNKLVAESRVLAVSVYYRRAPEHPLPAAYEDSWAALQWAVSHRNGGGPEAWLNNYADFRRVFLSGESAGANIAHNMAMMAAGNFDPKVGPTDYPRKLTKLAVDILGVALVHPYFWGSVPIGSETSDPVRRSTVDWLWPFVCPTSPGNDDPRVNPLAEGAPSLAGLGCRSVLVCVAEKDVLRGRGRVFVEALGRSGWTGRVEIYETEGEDHGFHLYDLGCEKACDLIRRLAAFFNNDMPPLA